MGHLVELETWPQDAMQNIAYFCGVIKERPGETYQESMQRAQQTGKSYFRRHAAHFWPNLASADGRNVRWELLADPDNREGEARFEAQYCRANTKGSERYVLSTAGSTKYRLKTDASGFNNLYITGDWIDNNFNSGCIEASVMAGMQTARAISGGDIHIINEQDEWLAEMFGTRPTKPVLWSQMIEGYHYAASLLRRRTPSSTHQ